jgi:hypothetical protein
MLWLLLVPLWCLALVSVVALCRAGHLEDVARGFVDDGPPAAPARPAVLTLAR